MSEGLDDLSANYFRSGGDLTGSKTPSQPGTVAPPPTTRAGEVRMDNWQDISTAPKDGTPVLLAYPWQGGSKRFIATWSRSASDWIMGENETGFHFAQPMRDGFTHWSPLPAPPTQTPGK